MGKGPKYVPKIARRHGNPVMEGRMRRGEGVGEGAQGSGADGKKPKSEVDYDEPDVSINHDRRLINVNASARVHWALGILGLDEDMRRLDLDKP